MRTEAEIREALELCNSEPVNPFDPLSAQGRDCTIEALRWVLGIDDADSSPMNRSFSELVAEMRDKQSTTTEE